MKAIQRTILFLLAILALSWIPRILFHGWISEDVGIGDLFHYKYLITSFLFDIKTASYWFGLLMLLLLLRLWFKSAYLQRAIGITAFFLSILYLVFCFIAYFYYPVLKTIVGKDLFTMIEGQSSGLVFGYVLEYWWAAILVLIIAQLFARSVSGLRFELRSWPLAGYVFLMLALWALAARGSITLKPLNHLDAFAALPANEAISAMSPAYVLLESFGQEGLQERNYHSEDYMEAERALDQVQIDGQGSWRPNICLILLESFGAEYTGLGDGPSYTPFLDSLMKESTRFTASYGNGLRSMDAVASIFLGVPALMQEPYVGSLYAHNEVRSIFDWLSPMGYNSSFFHGADRQSMGFSPFLKSHGLDRYYGSQDYPDPADHDGQWGIYDLPFLQFFGRELSKQQEPWFSTVFSLSSHHPYAVPEEFSYLPEGELDIHQPVGYTDESLRRFFAYAKTQDWFNRTLFVITADHASINTQKKFQTINGRFAIPFFLYHANWEPELKKGPAQHIDLIPTLLHILGYKGEVTSLGQDLMSSDRRPLVHFASPMYMITDSVFALAFDGEKVHGLYEQQQDPEHLKDLSQEHPKDSMRLESKLKARIQNFNERLIHNTYQ